MRATTKRANGFQHVLRIVGFLTALWVPWSAMTDETPFA